MKLKWNKILSDPAFWALLAVNAVVVYRYEQQPELFYTLIWLYWSQNILFGIFNYADIKTTKTLYVSPAQSGGNVPDKDYIPASIWFYTRLYFFFHVAYCIFLVTFFKGGIINWPFFFTFLLIFAICQLISFVQHKVQNKGKAGDVSQMTTRPFIRVVPVHLCIMIAGFMHAGMLTVFLLLKVITDQVMYVLTTNYYRNNTTTVVTAINLDSTISN